MKLQCENQNSLHVYLVRIFLQLHNFYVSLTLKNYLVAQIF